MEDHVQHRVRTKVGESFAKGFKILFFIIAGIAFVLLIGYIIMRLWNWLLPDIFGLMTINYWQAVGILILAKILFGSFGDLDSGKTKRRSRSRNKTKGCGPFKNNFSKWKHYDKFWEEEGEKAYEAYINGVNEKEQ